MIGASQPKAAACLVTRLASQHMQSGGERKFASACQYYLGNGRPEIFQLQPNHPKKTLRSVPGIIYDPKRLIYSHFKIAKQVYELANFWDGEPEGKKELLRLLTREGKWLRWEGEKEDSSKKPKAGCKDQVEEALLLGAAFNQCRGPVGVWGVFLGQEQGRAERAGDVASLAGGQERLRRGCLQRYRKLRDRTCADRG
uniref:hypothetical protein n=1 Tax=Phaeobacter sp. BS34 TaxID=2907240 RepID=UPI003704ABDE